jgi:phospholipase/carboxylesterase
VPELVSPQWPAVRFVFPHAPVRPVTVNNGMAMRAWYDIYGFDLMAQQDEKGIRASIGHLDALIAREHERGIPSERILLAGFSQGGAIALAGGLRYPEKAGRHHRAFHVPPARAHRWRPNAAQRMPTFPFSGVTARSIRW